MFSVGQHFTLYTYAWVGMCVARRLFFILSQISQITRIFYTVLKKLTRSFFEWEAMGLGIGRYGIVMGKLVGGMY